MTKAIVRSAAEKKAEDMGMKVGAALGALAGGAVGLGLCIACPVIPWIVGTMEITSTGVGVGAVGGGVVGSVVDDKLKK